MKKPALYYVHSPKQLPRPAAEGRMVLLDLAFAAGARYETATRPFIEAAGERLAAWIDHHPHPAWEAYRDDPRFVLVDKTEAPACPQLVTEARVEAIGPVEHLYAHADFDGFLCTVKWLLGGKSPWEEADEDARAIDAPGQGFVCSERGLRLARAVERSRDAYPGRHGDFLRSLADALVAGAEPAALEARIEEFGAELLERQGSLNELLADAEDDYPGILVLSLSKMVSPADKKYLLQELEARAAFAVIEEPTAVTVATFDTSLRLSRVKALHGTDGFAWGRASYDEIREDLIELLEEREDA